MSLIQPPAGATLKLTLARNLSRNLKRGHPWVFADALRQLPPASPGTPARLFDHRGRQEIAAGFYDPTSPLAFRVCSLDRRQRPNDYWAKQRFWAALTLRQTLFDAQTSAYRLFNGEGDGLPGLVCDLYGDTAVLQLDGAGPEGFWSPSGIAHWLAETLNLRCVILHTRTGSPAAQTLLGSAPTTAVPFLENGVHFTADLIQGQKTGFFLDQRRNRQQVRRLAANRRVLNMFGYTGGFSVYAGLGGATQVTTVDLAQPALDLATTNWQLNALPLAAHRTVAADAFDFLASAASRNDRWELVILDPPSFAPSQQAVSNALAAYRRLIAAGARVTASQGLLAAASCSSHVDLAAFLDACREGISAARRRATVLDVTGQPPDHPAPLALPEFRYLKFVLLGLE